jgi:hypothetical protein
MPLLEPRAVYDLEVAPNVVVLGIKQHGQAPEHLIIEQPIDGDLAAQIDARLNAGREVAGYNCSGYDSYLLWLLLDGAPPARVHEISQEIITGQGPAWRVAQAYGLQRAPYNELDLMHFTPRGRLKQYEGRLGLAIQDLPFDPHQPIPAAAMPAVVQYLEHDLLATERLREAVEPDVQARRVLEDLFGVPDLTKRTPANVAASIIVAEYTRHNPEVDANDLKAAAARKRNCEFEFFTPLWVREGIQGTLAEPLADAIDGTTFRVVDGVRQAPARDWPSVITLDAADGLQAAFGLGGIHTRDEACQYSGLSYDVASLYPHIIMHAECTPSHLDEAQFHAIYGRLIERRLQAKKAGDKPTSNALKLVLNSCFGSLNFKYSPLYSPDAFLAITVSGQLCLLALADRIGALGRTSQSGGGHV